MTTETRLYRGLARDNEEVVTTAAPVYTYKDLDIAFSTTLSQAACYDILFGDNSLMLMTPQVVDPDGQGAFLSLGELALPFGLFGPLPPGVTASGNPLGGDLVISGVPEAMVRSHPGGDGSAVAPPIGYSAIWSVEKGGWTIWRPTPPEGYAALGTVSTWDGDGNPPPNDAVVCVRRDLVSPATVGQWTWADHGSGASEDCTLWAIAPDAPLDGELNFSPGTLVGAGYYGPPGGDVQPFSLRIAVPETEPSSRPTPPKVIGPGDAPPTGADSVKASTDFPFFAVGDSQFDGIVAQMLASPTYSLVREDVYTLIPTPENPVTLVWNQSNAEQTPSFSVTAGYNEQETTDFSETTGIDFGVQFGGQDDPVSFTLQLTQSFTMSASLSHGVSVDYNVSIPLTVPPQTTTAAYWITSTFQLLRADGSAVGNPVTAGLDETIYYTSFPEKSPEE
jgi:hypothetical protein